MIINNIIMFVYLLFYNDLIMIINEGLNICIKIINIFKYIIE